MRGKRGYKFSKVGLDDFLCRGGEGGELVESGGKWIREGEDVYIYMFIYVFWVYFVKG